MDVNDHIDSFLSTNPGVKIESPQEHQRLPYNTNHDQQNLVADIKKEPDEMLHKQESNLDVKEEPAMKPFTFIDASSTADTDKYPTQTSNKSLKIVEAYTFIDTVDELKQGNKQSVLKQEPVENEFGECATSYPSPSTSKVRDKFDQCEYFCRICSEEFYTELKLTRHLMGVHKARINEYRKKFGHLLTKEVFHRCGLCGKKVRHSRNDIYKHLKQSKEHKSDATGLTMDIYHKRYMEVDWYNQCWFDCRQCQEKFMGKSDLVSHIRQKHGMKKVEMYINSQGPLMTRKETHQCKVCSELMLCTEVSVLQHLSVHKLSLKDYKAKYLEANAGNDDNHKKSTDNDTDDTLFKCNSCHKMFEFDYSQDLQKSHECRITRKKIPPSLKPKILEAFQKCEYFCRMCPEEFHSEYEIKTHIKEAHPEMVSKFKPKRLLGSADQFSYRVKASYGKLMTKEVKQICQLCHRNIRHELQAVQAHVTKVHGVDLVTYYKRFFQLKTEAKEIKIKMEVQDETQDK